MALPLALAVVLGAQTVCLAQAAESTTDTAQTRAEQAIDTTTDVRISDLPSGHWATNATQIAVANNILPLENGAFNGQDKLTRAELRHAMDGLVNVAETIAGKGALTDLRAAVGVVPAEETTVTRLELAQTLSRFLDAAAKTELVAMGAPRNDASRLKDLGATVPGAVRNVVDKYTVMTGYPDNTFKPSETVTRFQMAAVALEILDDMREAPLAQLPAAPVAAEPQAPTVVVVPPIEQEEEVVAEVPVDLTRPSFRENAPIHLSWQALNATNLSGNANTTGYGPFSVIPVTGMFTGYQGPLMLQNVTNFRYDVFQSNLLDTEFRLGYGDLKWGPLQAIPYIGANIGVGTAIPANATEYSTYVGATYGAILSVMPMNNLELWGNFGQSALLAGGRFNSSFQAQSYPNALGAMTSNYGVGADFYVAPNIALTASLGTWQMPYGLYVSNDLTTGGVINTYGGNLGVGFSF
jgi:hypothetical protein